MAPDVYCCLNGFRLGLAIVCVRICRESKIIILEKVNLVMIRFDFLFVGRDISVYRVGLRHHLVILRNIGRYLGYLVCESWWDTLTISQTTVISFGLQSTLSHRPRLWVAIVNSKTCLRFRRAKSFVSAFNNFLCIEK